MSDSFRLDDKVTLLPVVHRSGANARAIEEWLLQHPVDCLAVPLPPSFRESVLAGVEALPVVSLVVQAPAASARWDAEKGWLDSGDQTEKSLPQTTRQRRVCQSPSPIVMCRSIQARALLLQSDMRWANESPSDLLISKPMSLR